MNKLSFLYLLKNRLNHFKSNNGLQPIAKRDHVFVNHFCLSIILILGFLSFKANAEELKKTNFRFKSEIQSNLEKGKLYQLPLNSEFIQKSEKDLYDVRIFDSKDNALPYSIINNVIPVGEVKKSALKIIDYKESNNENLLIAEITEKAFPISLLNLDIENKDFKRDLVVYGSDDKKTWNLLSKNHIFDFSSVVNLRKTEIALKKNTYKYYKIVFLNNENTKLTEANLSMQYKDLKITFDKKENKKLKVNNIYAQNEVNKEEKVKYVTEVINKLSTTKDENKNTIITIGADLPFNKIVFSINNPYYSRNVTVFCSETGEKNDYTSLFEDTIYKINLNEIKEEKNFIKYNSNKHKFYKIVIKNQDSLPLDISKISFDYIQKDLYFIPSNSNEKYSLYVGNKNVEKPVYDFSNFLTPNNWHKQTFKPLKLNEITKNNNFVEFLTQQEKEKRQKGILMGIVYLVILVLGFWIYNMAKGIKKTNP